MRDNKRIVYAAGMLVLLLSLASFIGACVSRDLDSVRTANEGRQPFPGAAQRVTPHLKSQFESLEARQFVPVIIRLSGQSDLRMAGRVIEDQRRNSSQRDPPDAVNASDSHSQRGDHSEDYPDG